MRTEGQKASQKKWNAANPDAVKAIKARHRAKHYERIRERERLQSRAYYEANREKVIKANCDYAKRNKAQKNATGKAWKARNREKVKAAGRAYYYRKREEMRPRIKIAMRAQRLRVLAAYGGRCVCCFEADPNFMAMDHINGGGRQHRLSVGNIYLWLERNGFPGGFQVLCHNYNMAKGFYGHCPHNDIADLRTFCRRPDAA